jgi:hypothetical protein
MNKDRIFYNQICLDYTPEKLLDVITVKHIYEWSTFLYSIRFDEMKDVYAYLAEKHKQFEK